MAARHRARRSSFARWRRGWLLSASGGPTTLATPRQLSSTALPSWERRSFERTGTEPWTSSQTAVRSTCAGLLDAIFDSLLDRRRSPLGCIPRGATQPLAIERVHSRLGARYERHG